MVPIKLLVLVQAVEDPEPYQDFYTALGKSLFLAAQNVDLIAPSSDRNDHKTPLQWPCE